jgi:hypothetical protein
MYPCDISDHEAFIEEAVPGRKGIFNSRYHKKLL